MAASVRREDVSKSNVKLGFVEEVDFRQLSSKFFPSKVGGKPAWLSLDSVPDWDALKCGNCGGPTLFLIQVYAPLKSEDTFHRSVFIFVCVRDTCVNKNDNRNFKVLRSQLPLKNIFYSEDPPDENLDSDEDSNSFPHAKHFQNLCNVCGVKSLKKCAKCKKVYYCSREHQTMDWKCNHKRLCDEIAHQSENDLKDQNDHGHELLFKEFELVTEEEKEEELEVESKKGKSDEQRMEEYAIMMQTLKVKGSSVSGQYSEEDLNKAATGESDDDKHFLYFKKKIETEPTQVLRYLRGGEPLWVSAFHKAALENVPNCSCGAKRIFEFQVMPQLLHYVKVDCLDWGTLCVYTCAESCNIGNAYQEEFLWKQDFYSEKDSNKE